MTIGPNLSAWLAQRTPDQLAIILQRRPDMTWGPPLCGLDDLASRLAQPSSVIDAITQLPLPGVELLHALAALGPQPTILAASSLLASGDRGPQTQREAVRSVLQILEDAALAWREAGEAIALNPGVRFVVDVPLNIGRTVASQLERAPVDQLQLILRNLGLPDSPRRSAVIKTLQEFLTDHRRVRKLLDTAPEPVRRRMLALTTGGQSTEGYHPSDQQDREAEHWARRRGLVFGGQYYAAEVPVEVVLAVRDGDIKVTFEPDPPALDLGPVSPPAVTAGAAAAAAEFTETVAGLIDNIARTPIAALRAGGVGAREITRVAKSLSTEEAQVRLALEVGREIGLFVSGDARVETHSGARAWRASEPSARFADLAVAWWGLPVTPSITRDVEGRIIPTIGRRVADDSAMDFRWCVVAEIASMPPGSGVTTPDTLAARLAWRLPGLISRGDPAIAASWAEAHTLGVLAQGALTPIGSALLDGNPTALLGVAAELLAPSANLGRFGSDLTVMVAGAPSAAVSTLLDSCADRESRGAAVVWRFSPTSVRRALDDGTTAEELTSGLRAIAETDLPQPLTYLIGDVQRRHGTLVVQPALCCLRSDDQSLLIEVAAHRSLRSLRPQLLAPTVIAFQGDVSSVIGALRSAGYLPVPADEDGLVDLRRNARETAGRESGVAQVERMVDRLSELGSDFPTGASGFDPALRELAQAILSTAEGSTAGDPHREATQVEAMIDAFGSQLDPVERRQLAFAVENRVPVSITYQSASGRTTTRTISEIELINGLMYAWCHLRDDDRVFSIDRVQAVSPVHA